MTRMKKRSSLASTGRPPMRSSVESNGVTRTTTMNTATSQGRTRPVWGHASGDGRRGGSATGRSPEGGGPSACAGGGGMTVDGIAAVLGGLVGLVERRGVLGLADLAQVAGDTRADQDQQAPGDEGGEEGEDDQLLVDLLGDGPALGRPQLAQDHAVGLRATLTRLDGGDVAAERAGAEVGQPAGVGDARRLRVDGDRRQSLLGEEVDLEGGVGAEDARD